MKSGVIEEWAFGTSEGGGSRMFSAIGRNKRKQIGHQGIPLMWRIGLTAAATTKGMAASAPLKAGSRGTAISRLAAVKGSKQVGAAATDTRMDYSTRQ